MRIDTMCCTAAAVTLAGCAGSKPPSPLLASLTDGAGTAVGATDFEGRVAAVMEISPRPPAADPEPVCREEEVTGTHIRRTVCTTPPTEAEAEMNHEIFRSDLEYARELALRDEQERAERLLYDRMPQHVMDRMLRNR